MTYQGQVSIKYATSAKQSFYFVAFLVMQINYLLDASCPAPLVLLHDVGACGIF